MLDLVLGMRVEQKVRQWLLCTANVFFCFTCGSMTMSQTYTALTKQVDGWWVGWIEEIPGVNCQEPTRETLLETLAITLREAIAFNRQDALAMVGSDDREECIAL